MKENIRIIIADDHPVFIQGLVSILRDEPSIEIIGQASDGSMALTLIQKFKPDIAVLDIQMPEPDGIEIAKLLSTQAVPTKIIFLTMFKEESLIRKVFDLGVQGYVLKENAIAEIIQSIKTVYSGQQYISPQIASVLFAIRSRKEPAKEDQLTATERRVIKLIGQGRSSKEIAQELYISYKTVENHRSNISKKLGLAGHTALIMYAVKHKDDF